MAFAFTLWFGRLLLFNASGGVPFPQPIGCKPMEIEVERLPDYLWRDLGFPQPRLLPEEVKLFTPPVRLTP